MEDQANFLKAQGGFDNAALSPLLYIIIADFWAEIYRKFDKIKPSHVF